MGVLSTQGLEFQLVANGEILDLFKDEDILLSDNVTGLFDLGIIPADFTRQITLPGTKKNNAFFEHVYDISVYNPDTFATNIKVPAYLDFGGLYLSQGYLQLNKVNLFANKFIDSYEVTIFGAVSSFARQINRNYLTDLTSLNSYNHTSSIAAITSSWSGSLFNGDIVYPFAEYGQKIKYNPEEADYGIDSEFDALCVQDFKPAIRTKVVWDAIFSEAGYTYSSSFLEPYSYLPTVFNVSNNGSGNYVINGESNPTLTLAAGTTYTFNIRASGHPFWIKTVSSTGTGNSYNNGVTNNGTDNGTITFTVPYNAPASLYYNCQYHSGMAGGISVVKSVLDDTYLVCNRQLRYPVYSEINPETYGLFKTAPVSGSGATDLVLSATTDYRLPWANIITNPGGQMGTDLTFRNTYPTQLRGNINLNFQISASGAGNSVPLFTFKIKNLDTNVAVSDQRLGVINNYMDEIYEYNTPTTKTQTFNISQQFNSALLPSGSYGFYLLYNYSGSASNFTLTLDQGGQPKSYLEVIKATSIGDGLIMNIPLNMPFGTQGIRQIDFLTSIQKKYNLVIYPSKTSINEFIVEPFTNWYNKGRRWDFNQYANLNDKIEVIPANNLAVSELNFADTLDNDYISQQFNKEANREFGKQYYADTQNFFSQGKFEVKTTVASTQLLEIANTGLSGSVAGLNPTPVTAYAYEIGSEGYNSKYNACNNTTNYPTIVYAASSTSEGVNQFFYDEELSIGFNGNYEYWKWFKQGDVDFYTALITYGGNVYSIQNCAGV